jgi:hypothetical protein
MKFSELVEGKGSKSEADYQSTPKNGQKCINCSMWRDPNKCTAVAGNIDPNGWCKWYEGGAYGKRGKKIDEFKHGDYARAGGPMPKAKKSRTRHPLHGKLVG